MKIEKGMIDYEAEAIKIAGGIKQSDALNLIPEADRAREFDSEKKHVQIRPYEHIELGKTPTQNPVYFIDAEKMESRLYIAPSVDIPTMINITEIRFHAKEHGFNVWIETDFRKNKSFGYWRLYRWYQWHKSEE